MNMERPISLPDVEEIDRPAASRILATLIEASPLAIVTFDPEGVVTMWNPAAERIFGWSENEALGTRLPFVPAEKQEEFLALRRRALLGEVFTEPELHRRRADGSPIVVSVSTSPLRRPDGTIYGIMSILMDVTERKAAEESRARLAMVEEQLRQSQKMEAVGRLAGGVAHDFNNLLTAISGYSDLLLHRLPEYSTLRRDVEEIRKAGDRAAALTRQLLAFSRRQVLQPKVLDLNAVVTNMGQMLRRLIGEDIELSTDLSPSLSRVKADPGQIEQVIVNLAVNARDAMPDGGRITIATADAELSPAYAVAHPEVRPGPHVLLSVADTGHGMNDETQAHLFEPFFTTKERGKGTGLGLATVYGIVQQSGGHIRVNSAADRGSTFLIYLPRVEAPEDGVPGDGSTAPPSPFPGDRDGPPGRGRGGGAAACAGDPVGERLQGARGGERPRGAAALRSPSRGDPPAADRRGDAEDEREGAHRADPAPAPGPADPVHVGVHRRRHPPPRRPGGRDPLFAEAVHPGRARPEGARGAGLRLIFPRIS